MTEFYTVGYGGINIEDFIRNQQAQSAGGIIPEADIGLSSVKII
jgi:hypothetical protein